MMKSKTETKTKTNSSANENAKARKAVKRYDPGKARIWGSPDYLMMKFDDIYGLTELPRRHRRSKPVHDIVDGVSTDKDRLSVCRVYLASLRGPDGTPAGDAVVAHLSLGLNGHGRQTDYLAALRRLVGTKAFRIFDCWIDAVDDLADVMCTFDGSKCAKCVKGANGGKAVSHG